MVLLQGEVMLSSRIDSVQPGGCGFDKARFVACIPQTVSRPKHD